VARTGQKVIYNTVVENTDITKNKDNNNRKGENQASSASFLPLLETQVIINKDRTGEMYCIP
jgi:hypothetical protein